MRSKRFKKLSTSCWTISRIKKSLCMRDKTTLMGYWMSHLKHKNWPNSIKSKSGKSWRRCLTLMEVFLIWRRHFLKMSIKNFQRLKKKLNKIRWVLPRIKLKDLKTLKFRIRSKVRPRSNWFKEFLNLRSKIKSLTQKWKKSRVRDKKKEN